jgi:hypothetical protein
MSGGIIGRPKYDDTFVDISYPHVFKAPYRSVIAPRSDKIDPSDIHNEVFENTEYMSDSFNAIPQGTNIAASIGYGHSAISSNANLKRIGRNKPKGFQGSEPFWNPEGGWMIEYSDKKLPEDYYSENRRAVRYTTLDAIEDHWEDPMVIFPSTGKTRIRERDIVPVAPTAVYEIGIPEFEGRKPTVYKSTSAVTGMTVDFGPEDLPNPTQISKYIQSQNLFSILTPLYSTYIKMGEKIIPVKFKDPNRVALQAQSSLPIDIPLPDGTNVKIKDYRWVVVQNVNSDSELIFEIPVQLRDRPDISHTISQISAAHEMYLQKEVGQIQHRRVGKSVNTPIVDQQYNQYLDTSGRPSVSEEEHIRVSTNAPITDQHYNDYIESGGVHMLSDSKHYQSVTNAIEALPGGFVPVRAEIRQKPQINVQPLPGFTMPWVF